MKRKPKKDGKVIVAPRGTGKVLPTLPFPALACPSPLARKSKPRSVEADELMKSRIWVSIRSVLDQHVRLEITHDANQKLRAALDANSLDPGLTREELQALWQNFYSGGDQLQQDFHKYVKELLNEIGAYYRLRGFAETVLHGFPCDLTGSDVATDK